MKIDTQVTRTDRLLRVDACVSPGARAARLERVVGGTARAVPAGQVAADGNPDRRPGARCIRGHRRAGQVAAELLRRYGDIMTRMTLYTPYATDAAVTRQIAADLQGEPVP